MTKREILKALLDGKTLTDEYSTVKYNENFSLVHTDREGPSNVKFLAPEQWHIVIPKVKLYASVSSQINKNDSGWTIQFHKSEKTDRIRLPQFDCEVDA